MTAIKNDLPAKSPNANAGLSGPRLRRASVFQVLQLNQTQANLATVLKTESYLDKKRLPGTGPLRINTKLSLSPDMYSMFFTSTLNPNYVHYHNKIAAEQEKAGEDKMSVSRKAENG